MKRKQDSLLSTVTLTKDHLKLAMKAVHIKWQYMSSYEISKLRQPDLLEQGHHLVAKRVTADYRQKTIETANQRGSHSY
jgi:hypothetical protein